ncbi:hypothetical protein KZ813_01670 [Sphingomonas sp. RHCKR7]|uniref:hypothetical protein n=1 Tax=Sphingomonas folli TaxID=2862497 RepID=UPI001CA54753|nr:hypothetical protein [Sphingomonas folli]MBW6525541.1 hypothetical protein [Sphingomonas folli]
MTTPYDAAMRHNARALDSLRLEIARAMTEDEALSRRARHLSDEARRARANQIGDPLLDTSRYLAQAAAHRGSIERRRGEVAAAVGKLQDSAGSVAAELQAIRQLAATHRLTETRRLSAAEQRVIDDRFAALRTER